MNDDRLTRSMHEYLDGEATPEQAAALHARLAMDPAAAEEFASWQSLFSRLAETPVTHPPEGLVAAISAALPSHPAQKYSSGATQLSDAQLVIGKGLRGEKDFFFGLSGFFNRPGRPFSTTQESIHMNVNRKVLAGGALAVVALGVAAVLVGMNPKSENVVGTIVPAERYRAPQSGAEAVQLGQPATAQTGVAATDTSTDATADRASAEAKADRMDAAAKADKLDAAAKADRASAAAKADRMDAAAKADKLDAAAKADRASAAAKADRMDAAAKADKLDAAAKADRASAAAKADRMDAAAKADKADAAAKADKANLN